jgi:hypothetical protein
MASIKEYNEVAETALKHLVSFPSTYLCEKGFSALCEIKSKKRNRLACVDVPLRIALANIEPRYGKLVAAHQAQKSH